MRARTLVKRSVLERRVKCLSPRAETDFRRTWEPRRLPVTSKLAEQCHWFQPFAPIWSHKHEDTVILGHYAALRFFQTLRTIPARERVRFTTHQCQWDLYGPIDRHVSFDRCFKN
ncbi:hypothetical protein JOB18_019839 [Solea senegalensis]|uniref:Uncharacterized protein n=1 Tax=Solea senegalensis TaxID=28829 RepID=A0AAV6QLT8_SOLSE|nr:hypothetical protein JOB18_019839 [Solea senegalensis]